MVLEKVDAPPKISDSDRRTFELWIFRFHNYLNKMVYLNATASDVFLLCNGRNSIEEICKKMLCDYDVSYDIIKNDIVKIIRDLQWNNIIRLSRTKKVED